MKRQVLVGVLVLLAAGAANADPVINRVDNAVTKSRSLVLTVDATLAERGVVNVTGSVNGKPVALSKRHKSGQRTLKFVIAPGRLGLKKLTSGIQYTLQVAANENDGAPVTHDTSVNVPVPCIVLPGLGNELAPGEFAAFAAAVELAADGIHAAGGGTSPFVTVHEYASLSKSLAALGKGLDRIVKAALRRTPFAKVDLVGYSYGGVVARSYMAQKGGSRVRDCLFLGSPNEGTPIAYIGVFLLNNGQLATLLAQNPELAAAVDGLITEETKESLRNLYPTFAWISPAAALGLVPDRETPLTGLNAKSPPVGVAFHALYYSSTGQPIGTVEVVDSTALLALNGNIDPTTIATGSGDGVVPVRSVKMTDVDAWKNVITPHDLGAGTHVTMPTDPRIIGLVAGILSHFQ